MSTTNKQSFTVYVQDDTLADVVLGMRGIDPTATDKNAVSAAWGMIEKAQSSDYSQGRTSESLSTSARAQLMRTGKEILKANGIFYFPLKSTISGVIW